MVSEQNSQRNVRLILQSGMQKSVALLPQKKEETRQLNSFLETMQAQIYEAQRTLLNKKKEITVRYFRVSDEKATEIISVNQSEVSKWESIAEKIGIPKTERNAVAKAFKFK